MASPGPLQDAPYWNPVTLLCSHIVVGSTGLWGGHADVLWLTAPLRSQVTATINGQAHEQARLHGLLVARLGAAPEDTEWVRDE